MQIVLYVVLVIMLFQDQDNFLNGVGPALPWSFALCVISLSCGYGFARLVGLTQTEAATVAIESSIRNLAVAFLIATSVLGRLDVAVLPGVYFIAVLVVGMLFARFWRTRMVPAMTTGQTNEPEL